MTQPWQSTVSVGVVGSIGGPDDRVLRLASIHDIWRLSGPGWAARSPALVAAALALLEGVPRVVLAPTVAALPSDIALAAIVDPLPPAAREALRAPRGGLLLADVGDDVSPGEVLAAQRRGVRFVIGIANFLLPGVPNAALVGGAALALPLVFGRPMLGPRVDFIPQPVAPEMRGVGALVLVTYTPKRSPPRVVLPVTERGRSDAAPEPTPSEPDARLEDALRALSERVIDPLEEDPAGVVSLEREARRMLSSEIESGAITGFTIAIEPIGEALAIEVVVMVPRREDPVVIRVVKAGDTRARS